MKKIFIFKNWRKWCHKLIKIQTKTLVKKIVKDMILTLF